MLSSLTTYSRFVYTVPDRFPAVKRSSLVLKPMGATIGELEGKLEFEAGVYLKIYEVINFAAATLSYYSYTVYQGETRLYWYDPQPHPNTPELASTHPHHKHISPNIKRNRIPAPDLTFTAPNLPFLIDEVERTVLSKR